MKLKINYQKLAEFFGLEVGQEFNVYTDPHVDVPVYNPYKITTSGILDSDGEVMRSYVFRELLSGKLTCEPIAKSLLTKEEKAFVKSVSDIIGMPVYKVCRVPYFFKEDYYFLRIDCQGGGGQTRSTFELHHGGYENLVPDVEYTPKELGLED